MLVSYHSMGLQLNILHKKNKRNGEELMEIGLFQADVTNVTCHVTSRVRDVTEDCTTPLVVLVAAN